MSMSTRLKIILVVISAVLVVSLIVGGVVVFANTTTTTTTTNSTTTTTKNPFLTALAKKLGISVDQLTQDIQEARSEVQSQALKDRLQKLVDAGKLTQQQMDDYLNWWNSRPQLPSGVLGSNLSGLGNSFGSGYRGSEMGRFNKGFRLPGQLPPVTSTPSNGT